MSFEIGFDTSRVKKEVKVVEAKKTKLRKTYPKYYTYQYDARIDYSKVKDLCEEKGITTEDYLCGNYNFWEDSVMIG